MTIDLEKALKTSADPNIKQHAVRIAEVLTTAGVKDRTSLYNARGNVHLPTGLGTDIFQVVAHLDGKFADAEAAEAKAAETVEAKPTKAQPAKGDN